jgi:spermidine synthase
VSVRSPLLLLIAAGFNLVLIQLIIVRELSITLFCTELVVMLVTLGYFTGHLLGYGFYDRISLKMARFWLAFSILSHLPAVAAVRVFSAWLAEHNYDGVSRVMVFLFCSLFMTSFYAIFLPKIIELGENKSLGVASCYRAELLGGALALLSTGLAGSKFLEFAAVTYLLALLVIAWCLDFTVPKLSCLAACAVIVLYWLPQLDRASTNYFYNHFYSWFKNVEVLHSEHTPYQKIEVLKDADDQRYLYLNGIEYFSTGGSLETFNFYLSGVPGRLRPGAKVLIVGSGSMSSLGHLAPYVSSITTVEIDQRVAEICREYFSDFNKLEELKIPWNLVIDDAKHYLANTDQEYDLIIIDVPAPFYLQTGMLFTREFYQLTKGKLAPGGLLSIYVPEYYEPGGEESSVARPVLAAVSAVYPEFVIINASQAGKTFVLAGSPLEIDLQALVDATLSNGLVFELLTYEMEKVTKDLAEVEPASYNNLRVVWELTRWAYRF